MGIWMNKKTKTKIHPIGKHWVNNACVSARACRERERNLNGSQLQELVIKYLCLYLFGHFHYAWFFTWYAQQMQYLDLKTKAQLFAGAFVYKHEVIVRNSVLSEHFEVMRTQKDGLRWIIFSTENVGRLISYYHISGKLELMYPEKQQGNSKKDNGSKQMEGVMQGEGMLDKIGTVQWTSLPNTPVLWITSVTNYNIVTGNLLQVKPMFQMQFIGKRMKAQCIS